MHHSREALLLLFITLHHLLVLCTHPLSWVALQRHQSMQGSVPKYSDGHNEHVSCTGNASPCKSMPELRCSY